MNWKKIGWLFPLVAVVAVFAGFALFSLPAFTPEMSAEVAVATGIRPASSLFPGLWRHFAAILPPTAAAYGFVGHVLAAAFAFFLYLCIRHALLLLQQAHNRSDSIKDFYIPLVSLLCSVMGSFAEPVWRAFSLFSPTALILLYIVVAVFLFLDWIVKGGWMRQCGGIFLMGVFSAESPLAALIPVACVVTYLLLWNAVKNGVYEPREDLPEPTRLPLWRMFISFVAGLGLCVSVNLETASDMAGSLGWKFTYILFHYWQQYLIQMTSASTFAGWMLGIPLCVIPFLATAKLLPKLTDDDRPLPFGFGLVVLFCGIIAYFEQGPLRGAWFWTWVGDKDLVRSPSLLAFFSLLSTCAVACVATIFVVDAFNLQRSQYRERGVNLTYRISIAVYMAVVALLVVFRMPHTNVRKVLAFNDSAIKETYRELNGARFVFTDGSADAELELVAAADGKQLSAIDLMGDASVNAEALRLRGLTDEGDIIAARIGSAALLRVWALDKPNGLDNAALQIGLDLWKREQKLTPPMASAFVARTKGLRDEDIQDASKIAKSFADKIVELTPLANAVDIPPSVRKLFFTISWRISRFSRYRKDSELADRLDVLNSALKQMLRDLEYARMQVFLQMTPKEGLELALRRADFQDAARYAASVLKIDAEDPRGNFGMGMYFLMANRFEEAEKYLRRVLIKRPDEPAALNNISIICRKTRRYEEAVKLAKRALELLPDNVDVQQTLKDAEAAVPKKEESNK